MRARKIAVLVGSLRKASFTRKIANSLVALAPETISLSIVEIEELPLYNEDWEAAGPPQAWLRFRDEIRQADGIVFCTPEYNRSLSAALKNAIDVGSRPYGQSAIAGKPSAVVSSSPGPLGGFAANHAIRQCLVCLNMPCMPTPEAYLGSILSKFDGDRLNDEYTQTLLRQFLLAFSEWVERHAA